MLLANGGIRGSSRDGGIKPQAKTCGFFYVILTFTGRGILKFFQEFLKKVSGGNKF
jgi:hypothetical protein